MVRTKKYKITLTDEDVDFLKSIIRNKKTSKTIRCRCQILLDIDESHGKAITYEQSAKSNGVCISTVSNTIRQYFEEGINSVVELKRSINSDNAKRKIDDKVEARLIEIACGPVPEGHSRWTLRLVEEKVKVDFDIHISKDTIGRAFKKNGFVLKEKTNNISCQNKIGNS